MRPKRSTTVAVAAMARSFFLAWVPSLGLLLSADLAAQPAAPHPLPGEPRTQSLPQTSLFPAFLALFVIPVSLVPLFLALRLLQRAQREQNAEEEDKTKYTEEDLMEDWEFKIIRNPYRQFEHRAYLEKILQEEAQAGWRLVEKFDGMRVRLKRPVSVRAGDANLPPEYDPYRTVVRPNINLRRDITMLFCLVVFLLCAAFIAFGPFLLDSISPELLRTVRWASFAAAIPFGAIAAYLIVRTMRERRAV
jgi:hypothetical protein